MIDSEKLSRWYDFQAPFFSLWRDDYDGPLVKRVIGLLAARGSDELEILDAGCGTGLFSVGVAAGDEGWRITGLDYSAGMLAVARRKARQLGRDNVAFLRGDVTRLPYGNESFDAVVAAGLFPNLNEPAPALLEFHRVLRPGGNLIVLEVDRESMSWSFRAFFRVMILGYRAIATVLPRFRFSEDWNVRRSTIERARFEEQLTEAGFTQRDVAVDQHHLIFRLEK